MRRLVAAATLLITPFVGLGSTGVASASPETAPVPAVQPGVDVAGATTGLLPLPYNLGISGGNGNARIRVTLPEDATATALSGEIIANYTRGGTIKVLVNGRLAAQVNARTGGPIKVPLTPAESANGGLDIALIAAVDTDANCFLDDNSTATLKSALVSYSYQATPPTTVGAFLSNGIQSYTVVVPPNASPPVTQAGLDAVAALTFRYPAPTRVVLAATESIPTPNFLNRVVRFSPTEASTSTTSVDSAGILTIAGPPGSLAPAAVALANPNTDLLQVQSTQGLRSGSDFRLLTGEIPLDKLGNAPVSLAGIGRLSTLLSLDQPTFGQQLQAMSIKLHGAITPLPKGGQGRVDFLWNGALVSSLTMDDNTTVDTTIEVSGTQLQRANGLTVELTYVPPGGKCTPQTLPARVDIDVEKSTATPSAGTALLPGFERFPQAFQGNVVVGLGDTGELPVQIADAGAMIASLQSSSSQQLTTEVVDADKAQRGSQPALLVGTDAATAAELQAPVSSNSETLVDSNGNQMAFTAGPFGALQAFQGTEKDLILLGGISPTPAGQAAANDYARRLSATTYLTPGRWSSLQGKAVLRGSDKESVTVEFPDSPQPTGWRFSPLLAMVIAFVVLLAGLLIWLWRRPKGAAPPKPGTE